MCKVKKKKKNKAAHTEICPSGFTGEDKKGTLKAKKTLMKIVSSRSADEKHN